MARITVEDCLKVEPNRFQLVHMAIQRAKQLLKAQNANNANSMQMAAASKQTGSKRSVDRSNKHVVNSLREIASGTVRLMTDEEMLDLATSQEQSSLEDSPMTEADKILSRLGLSTQPDVIDAMLADDSAEPGSEEEEPAEEAF